MTLTELSGYSRCLDFSVFSVAFHVCSRIYIQVQYLSGVISDVKELVRKILCIFESQTIYLIIVDKRFSVIQLENMEYFEYKRGYIRYLTIVRSR